MKRLYRIALGALVTLALASCGGKWEEVEYETGYEGPARWNPFLAAERFITAMGIPAQNMISLAELPPEYDAMIVPSGAVAAYGMTPPLYQWVLKGGHLIYLLEGGERFLRDWADVPSPNELLEENPEAMDGRKDADTPEVSNDPEIPEDEDPILKRFDIKRRVLPETPDHVVLRGERLDVDLPSRQAFIDPTAPSGSKNKKKRRRTPLFTSALGDGRITVISHGKPFRNRYIGEKDHARLLWNIIQLQPANTVWFVLGGRTSLWGMVWHYGWTVVIGLGLVIILWLWLSLSRFGPLLSPETNGTRDFFEHIDMTGKFLWRRGRSESLLEPLRQDIILSFQKKLHLARHPGSGLQDAELEAIAEHTGLSIEVIRNAFTKKNITDPAELTRIVRDLQQIQSTP